MVVLGEKFPAGCWWQKGPRAWPSSFPHGKGGWSISFPKAPDACNSDMMDDHPVHRSFPCFQKNNKTKQIWEWQSSANHNIGEYSFASQHTTYSIKTYISESISIQPSFSTPSGPLISQNKKHIPGPSKGCQMVRLTGVNSPSLRVFPWNPWKVQVLIVFVSHAHQDSISEATPSCWSIDLHNLQFQHKAGHDPSTTGTLQPNAWGWLPGGRGSFLVLLMFCKSSFFLKQKQVLKKKHPKILTRHCLWVIFCFVFFCFTFFKDICFSNTCHQKFLSQRWVANRIQGLCGHNANCSCKATSHKFSCQPTWQWRSRVNGSRKFWRKQLWWKMIGYFCWVRNFQIYSTIQFANSFWSKEHLHICHQLARFGDQLHISSMIILKWALATATHATWVKLTAWRNEYLW